MWNLYVFGLLVLYAPSNKRFVAEDMQDEGNLLLCHHQVINKNYKHQLLEDFISLLLIIVCLSPNKILSIAQHMLYILVENLSYNTLKLSYTILLKVFSMMLCFKQFYLKWVVFSFPYEIFGKNMLFNKFFSFSFHHLLLIFVFIVYLLCFK